MVSAVFPVLVGVKVILAMFPLPLNAGAGAVDVATNLYSPMFWLRLFDAINMGAKGVSCRMPSGWVSMPILVSMFVA